jgi:hypothetical protein
MRCPPNLIPTNRISTKSGAAVFLEGGMRAEAVSIRLIPPTPFPAGSGTGKRWQVFSNSAIQPGPYLHQGSATSPTVFPETVKFRNMLNLMYFLGICQNGIIRNLPASESIPNQCNLSLIPACPALGRDRGRQAGG